MTQQPDYSMHLNLLHDHHEKIDVARLVRECEEPWWNQTLCAVNDCVVRLGVIEGDFHWHKHDEEDEFFLVLEGKLFVDLEGETIELGPHQGTTVSKGVLHRTRAPERTAILMVEKRSVEPTGD